MAKGVTVDLIVDPKKAIEGIGQVESKASGAAEKLSKFGGLVGASLAGLGAAAVAGAAALGTAAVKSFAEYEQLAGGVTKLFGEADDTVTKFAQNAATSAGLSTNAYLETVTSFSASLITGLNGDQEAAARAADQAITDMADNANTFGTSIESLQIAYQGFAKGNFALLDNLKLGYGGSQEGMAKLINDSGVLGDTMKVTAQTVKDVPFDKMVEAIHRVQESMGIAGTTAKEAASTIAGSFDATKASLDNLVAGLGNADSDFDTLVGNVTTNAQNLINNVAPVIGRLADALPAIVPVLISAIQTALPALIPLAANLIASVLQGIVQAAPALVTGAIPIILNLVTGILRMLPQILTAGIQVLLALVKGIAAALPQLIPAAIDALLGLVTALLNNLPLLIDAGIELVLGLALGLVDAIPQLVEAIPTIITSLITGLVGAIPKLVMAGVKLIVALVENLPAIIEGIISAVPQIIDALIKAFGDPKFWKALGDAGFALIEGLWEGIKGAADWLWKHLSSFFGDVIDNIKGLFGIHSPSTVFAGFGVNMIEGLEKGLSGPNHLGAIGQDLSKQVTAGFQGEIQLQARSALSLSSGTGTAAASTSPADAAPSVTNNIYMLPEQDPRVVARQFAREFARTMAGTT